MLNVSLQVDIDLMQVVVVDNNQTAEFEIDADGEREPLIPKRLNYFELNYYFIVILNSLKVFHTNNNSLLLSS